MKIRKNKGSKYFRLKRKFRKEQEIAKTPESQALATSRLSKVLKLPRYFASEGGSPYYFGHQTQKGKKEILRACEEIQRWEDNGVC